MQCLHCGNQFSDNMPSCPNCGAPVSTPYMQGQPYGNQAFGQQAQPYGNQTFGQQAQPYGNQVYGQQAQPYGYGAPMSKKEFSKHPNIKKCSGNIKGSAIALYVCAGITMAAGLFMDNYLSILDVMIIVGLALGIHLAQSRACSIILCAYSIFNVIIMIASTGKPGGWLIVIAAVDAIIYTFRFQKAWKEYQQTGIVPMVK